MKPLVENGEISTENGAILTENTATLEGVFLPETIMGVIRSDKNFYRMHPCPQYFLPETTEGCSFLLYA